MNNISRFVVIDDDPISNTLCKMMINRVIGEIEVRTFTLPDKGFEYISSEYSKAGFGLHSIILLDLNMPLMTGWEFLERFEELDKKIKNQYKIFIHSSSANLLDMQRARTYKTVVDYIIKPLTIEKIRLFTGR